MTNEEAILDLQFLARRYEEFDQICHLINGESLNIAISALDFNKLVESEQENTKLKVEIEQLKIENEKYKSYLLKLGGIF